MGSQRSVYVFNYVEPELSLVCRFKLVASKTFIQFQIQRQTFLPFEHKIFCILEAVLNYFLLQRQETRARLGGLHPQTRVPKLAEVRQPVHSRLLPQ